jgi:hypothetical protein
MEADMATELAPVVWTGESGIKYEFELDPVGVTYKPRPGVYIFCRVARLGFWRPIYIGQTASFYRRLTECLEAHHKFDDIRAAGATHLCTLHVTRGLTARLRIETDLRHFYQTPCNDQ